MTKQELLQDAKPILFNTAMVEAILEGRKTTTRRPIKPHSPGLDMWKMNDCHTPSVMDEVGRHYPQYAIRTSGYDYRGMILWVRETWNALPVSPGGHLRGHDVYYYKAGGDIRPSAWQSNWNPSIHMPKEAARLFLRVTDIHAERLWDMNLDDFLAEGVGLLPEAFNDPDNAYGQARGQFSSVWDSTVKKPDLDRYGWDANPWVWVVEFERVEI